MTHEIKSHPDPFQARWTGLKTWEFRKNDRDYKVGDHLHEREWQPQQSLGDGEGAWTGRNILSRVTYAFYGGQFGIPDGYVIMSLETIARGIWTPKTERIA